MEGHREQHEHDMHINEPIREDGSHRGGHGAVEEEVEEGGRGFLEVKVAMEILGVACNPHSDT